MCLGVAACMTRESGRVVVQQSRCDASPAAQHKADSLIRIPSGDGLNVFEECWYSEHLYAMGEPRLSDAAVGVGDTVIRMTCLPTFMPGIAIRAELRGGGARLRATALNGQGGYEPGTVARREERELMASDWAALSQRTTDLWPTPTAQPGDIMSVDGTTWIIELKANDRYHRVVRVRPDSGLRRLIAALAGAAHRIDTAACS
jgi:hypothetical protein